MIDEIDEILKLFKIEMMTATQKFGKFNSAHEGYAVLLEEVDELWGNIKLNQFKNPNRIELIKYEAIHVGAMVLRLIYDCCGNKTIIEKTIVKSPHLGAQPQPIAPMDATDRYNYINKDGKANTCKNCGGLISWDKYPDVKHPIHVDKEGKIIGDGSCPDFG